MTFQTKGDADAWLSQQSAALTEHRWRPPAPVEKAALPTFETYVTTWLAGRELKPRTREEYRKLAGLPKADGVERERRGGVTLLDTFKDSTLDQITPAAVRTWYTGLDATKPTRRAHLYALLRTVLGSAVEDELLPANPCTVKAAGKAKRARVVKVAERAELDKITAEIPERWAMLVTLSTFCALRFGEVTALRRRDLDVDAGVIRVRTGVTWLDGEALVSTPKSVAGTRDVPLPPHLVQAMKDHLDTWAEPGRDGLVFPAVGGGVLNHGTFHKHWRKARAAADRDDLRVHDLRHTGAVMWARAGATTKELMVLMGHTTPTMAMLYQHMASGRPKDLAARVSAMLEDA